MPLDAHRAERSCTAPFRRGSRGIGVRALAVIGFGMACSEYNVVPSVKDGLVDGDPVVDTAEPSPDTGAPPADSTDVPIAMVTPDDVDGDIFCGLYEETVSISNIGLAPLVVDELLLTGSGWSMEHPELPITLAFSESIEVAVMSSGGNGMLVINSNDPDVPNREVPLHVVQDQPPTVSLLSPSAGAVISPGAASVFEAVVEDDYDLPDALGVEWSSSVDGEVSTAPAASDGVALLWWSGASMSSGDHNVCVDVTDSCGQTASSCVGVCQNEGYTEESIDLEGWNFEGSALWDATNEWVELTAPIGTQAGTAFQTMSTVVSDLLEIEFEFFVSGGSGADGISLTMIDADRMTTFVGGTGGGIGYYGLPGWSLEIDTWYNAEHSDPTPLDHVSVHIDGDVNAPRAWAALPEMEDGAWHVAKAVVTGPHLQFWVDEVLYIDEHIDGLTPFNGYVGFTGSTGGSTNWHLIDALDVEGMVCD